MCSPVTSRGGPRRRKRVGALCPSKTAEHRFVSSTRNSLTTEALGRMVPASYFVKARGPPPRSSPLLPGESPSLSGSHGSRLAQGPVQKFPCLVSRGT